jgi:RNA polymerase sigma-70 factor (ECF subfamily)
VDTSHLLFTTYRDGVFRYLSRIVGPHDASDLTQEVFLRVSRSVAPETDAGEQRAWVFRIARNLALNHRRDTERRPRLVALVDAPRSANQEDALAVREALAQLAALDRDVFLLREVAGLSYDELASACELTPDAVRSRLHRARQQLRTFLSPASRRRVGFHAREQP